MKESEALEGGATPLLQGLKNFHRYVFRVEALSKSPAMESAATRKEYLGKNLGTSLLQGLENFS